jgi:hypothetical protein
MGVMAACVGTVGFLWLRPGTTPDVLASPCCLVAEGGGVGTDFRLVMYSVLPLPGLSGGGIIPSPI